jgi:hypothetical protein
VLDAEARGKLIALLVVGFSLRQAAGVIGVSHTALRKLLARDPELMTEVNVSRSRAAMEPLAVVIRESKRSWRAATWLLKYLDSKLYSREETLDEWEQRMEEERAEFKKRNRSR